MANPACERSSQPPVRRLVIECSGPGQPKGHWNSNWNVPLRLTRIGYVKSQLYAFICGNG
jgi:hypothetical protein